MTYVLACQVNYFKNVLFVLALPCFNDEFSCDNGASCVHQRFVCDKDNTDCNDGSDESNCRKFSHCIHYLLVRLKSVLLITCVNYRHFQLRNGFACPIEFNVDARGTFGRAQKKAHYQKFVTFCACVRIQRLLPC